jgi:cytochrome c biogenesis protein CcmG, thiol:disulfide interchange protein DsbE
MASVDSGRAGGAVAGPGRGAARSVRMTQVGLGLGVALAILVGAWFVGGGRSGWDVVGRGGINQSLLPKVGDQAPDFTTSDLFGNPVSLSQFRGRPVWLMFWGSWCPPCRAEFPDVQRAYERLEPEGVRLLGVSVREPWQAAAAYAAQNKATFVVLTDEDETDTGAAYPLYNVPTHIFIDGDGVIRSIVMADMSEERALSEARALLKPVRDS